jgi:hypothetical protein
MRANTDRSAALDFGKLVDHYDAGRISCPPDFVHQVARRLGIPAGARRLEVGAGTGQLTSALLAAGGEVVAVEPSGPMADRLRQNRGSDVAAGRLRICAQPFETLRAADFEPFGQLWSSDAWHWIDPLIGYRLAASLLRPGGFLICSWSFPVLTDPALQLRLNDLYSLLSPDQVRDPLGLPAQIEPLLAEGRQQVSDSGCMTVVDHWTESAQCDVSVPGYIDLQLSYAHVAALTADQRAALGHGIRAVVADLHAPTRIRLTVIRYTVASQPLLAAG